MEKSSRQQKAVIYASTTAQRWKNSYIRNMILEDMRDDYSHELKETSSQKRMQQELDTSDNITPVTNTINEYKKLKLKKVKFEVLLLTFIFNEDDGIITSKEKAIIKKYFKKYKKTISKEDIKEISEIEVVSSMKDIEEYIKSNQITSLIIRDTLSLLRAITHNKDRYTYIILELEKHLSKGEQ